MSAPLNLEPKARTFVDALAAANLPPFESGTAAQARALTKALRPAREPRPIAEVASLAAPGKGGEIPIRRYRDTDAPIAAVLYLHAGGWVLGGIEDSDNFARELAAVTGCEVYSVDYRLAPEARFPAAIDDAEAALEWLERETRLPIVLFGESAGGNLATIAARRSGRVALQILAYPVTDSGMDTASYAQFADGPLLTAPLMAWFWDHYIPDTAARGDPRASPLRADWLAGLPPALIITAENDPLRDEGEAYADALAAAGVAVTKRRYAGQIHSFIGMVGLFDGGKAALDEIAGAIRDAVTA